MINENQSKGVKVEGLRLFVSRRKNSSIINCIDDISDKFNELNENNPSLSGDEVDGDDDDEDGQLSCNKIFKSGSAFSVAVLFATLNDDSETLNALLEWWKKKKEEENEPPNNCALVFACLENYVQCIKPLYRMNYRIDLHPEDEADVDQILHMKAMCNEADFWYYLYCMKKRKPDKIKKEGNLNIKSSAEDDCAVEMSPLKSDDEQTVGNGDAPAYHRSSSIKEKMKKVKLPVVNTKAALSGNNDSVESFLKLKAYSNPNYLSVMFLEKESKDLRCDPLRKSLAIARYTWLRCNYDQQYSQEYSEINKVEYRIEYQIQR